MALGELPQPALLPYSGPMTICPKCGKAGCVGTHWHLRAQRDRKFACSSFRPGEHLCRLCGNCGYRWIEATADQGST
jgi:hypothetical protein